MHRQISLLIALTFACSALISSCSPKKKTSHNLTQVPDGKFSPDGLPSSKGPRMGKPHMDVYFHRLSGAGRKLPENSIAGLVFALEQIAMRGFGNLELDTQYIGGELVLLHDEDITPEKFLNMSGNPALRTPAHQEALPNLRKYRFVNEKFLPKAVRGDRLSELAAQSRIPTLGEFLEALLIWETRNPMAHKPLLNIEMKRSLSEHLHSRSVLLAVKEAGLANRTIIQSFKGNDLLVARKEAEIWKVEGVRFAFLQGKQNSFTKFFSKSYVDKVQEYKADIFSPNYEIITRDDVRKMHDIDVQVIPYTVNSPGDMRKLYEMGVDAIISDFGERAQKEILSY